MRLARSFTAVAHKQVSTPLYSDILESSVVKWG
jgi:hypothetical protein